MNAQNNLCTAWISWEKSFNLKLALEHCKFYAQDGLCQACLRCTLHKCVILRHKNILMFMCVHTLSWPCQCTTLLWPRVINNVFCGRTIAWNWNFCIRKTFLWKLKPGRQIHPHSQCLVPGAPLQRNLNHYPSLLIWLHLKCCCWRLRECHFIYDNIQN